MAEENTHLAGISRLRQVSDQISTLISFSHSIKVFSSKWKLVRNKLDEILLILASLPPEIQDSGDIPTLSSVTHSIEETTEHAMKLGQKCLENSYSGKLLMQSDLDIIFVKFDTHMKSLSDLVYADGVLSNGYFAIVVSRPGPTASRDDIKFYVKDLLTRFKIGGSEMRKQALASFNELIQEDERCVKIAMEIEGLVGVLMGFLSSIEVGVQEEALKSLAVICGFDSYKGVLVGLGVVAPLVRVLEGGSELGKELSTRCLMKVTAESDNAWAVSAHGGVTALLKICGRGEDYCGELVGLACGVLRNLVGVVEIKRFVVEKGTIPMFIALIRSKNEATQINAIEFVQVMASGNESVRGLIVNEGGIRVLVCVLDPKSSFSSKAKEKSIRAIMGLSSNSIGCLNTLKSYGFFDHILYYLHNGDLSIQESSLKASFWLCKTSEEIKKTMGDMGFMEELVKFLNAKSFEVRETAAENLLGLVLVPKNRKRFVQNDQNVSLILQLIDPDENSGNIKILLSIIMSLTSCNIGRKKILSSGYLKNLDKLAEAEVSDAKKIVKSLSLNRFSSMIRGIWHS